MMLCKCRPHLYFLVLQCLMLCFGLINYLHWCNILDFKYFFRLGERRRPSRVCGFGVRGFCLATPAPFFSLKTSTHRQLWNEFQCYVCLKHTVLYVSMLQTTTTLINFAIKSSLQYIHSIYSNLLVYHCTFCIHFMVLPLALRIIILTIHDICSNWHI